MDRVHLGLSLKRKCKMHEEFFLLLHTASVLRVGRVVGQFKLILKELSHEIEMT